MKPNEKVKTDFAVHEVVVLTGFTKYMLDYLARDGIFGPTERSESRRGLRRRYTYADVVLLRALQTLCDRKGKIRHLREALQSFRDEFGSLLPGQRLDKLLFVTGNELCVHTAESGGRQLRGGQMLFSFVVDLGQITDLISNCIVLDEQVGFRLSDATASQAEDVRQQIWAPIKARRLRA